jgi:ABC-type glycerol-3-phosphate transport system substrate-binding protein
MLSLLLGSVACAAADTATNQPTQPEVTPAFQTEEPLVIATTPTATQTASSPSTLTLWLPPEFDPQAGTPAGDLLQERLDAFEAQFPGIQVVTRIKAVEGPGGMYDALSTADAAAPLVLPDLLALPQPILQAAALKGLLQPLDGLTSTLGEPDWYDFARQLAMLQDSQFGIPFAGDTLVLAYRPSSSAQPPANWDELIAAPAPLVFAAADAQSLFTLAQYIANGGAVTDDQGRAVLDPILLADVLGMYQAAAQNGVMPFWLTQFINHDQAWEAFLENTADHVVTWVSRPLADRPPEVAIAPLPTPAGTPAGQATGWSWALGNPRGQQQELAITLAEFLTESSFLASWSEAAGYLPPRPSSLAAWSQTDKAAQLQAISQVLQVYPASDILTELGPALQQATVEILKQESEPGTAAQTAADSLKTP